MATKSERTRRMIIERSAELFNQQGFHGTSMADIMAATGLTKGGIYGNFRRSGGDKKGVKEEIAVAAFEFAVAEVTRTIRERTKVMDNVQDKLRSVVYYYKERVLNPAISGGCPIQNTSVEADDNHPVLRDKVREKMDEWHARMTHVLKRGIARREIRADLDAAEFSTLFIATLEGGILLAQLYKDSDRFDVAARQLLRLIDELKPVNAQILPTNQSV